MLLLLLLLLCESCWAAAGVTVIPQERAKSTRVRNRDKVGTVPTLSEGHWHCFDPAAPEATPVSAALRHTPPSALHSPPSTTLRHIPLFALRTLYTARATALLHHLLGSCNDDDDDDDDRPVKICCQHFALIMSPVA